MADLSGGRRATKGLTLQKRPCLRHFQMGAPSPLPDPLEYNM